jgi:hypothetical protein
MTVLLTSINSRATTEPVSDCSPIYRSLRDGFRERICTTGVPEISCRRFDNEEVRCKIRDESRRGRNGRYAERNLRPSVIAGNVK